MIPCLLISQSYAFFPSSKLTSNETDTDKDSTSSKLFKIIFIFLLQFCIFYKINDIGLNLESYNAAVRAYLPINLS